jgi:hypothetical protein
MHMVARMTAHSADCARVEEALAVVKAAGYVVLKEKSYRQAQERQRVAEALRKLEQEHNEHTRAWANKAFDEQRHLRDRCEYLYGLAAKLGAGDRQLRGEHIDGGES